MTDITEHLTNSNKRKRSAYLKAAARIYKTLAQPVRVILTISDFHFEGSRSAFRLQVHLAPDSSIDTELAYFSIYGNYIRTPFENLTRITAPNYAPPMMNIDCDDYRGKHVSKMLILLAFYFAKKEYPRFNPSSELFIDTDASTIVGYDASLNKVSYWTAIGMTDNETNPSCKISTGYEKRCRVEQLNTYLFTPFLI
jgi:hypothetical protein